LLLVLAGLTIVASLHSLAWLGEARQPGSGRWFLGEVLIAGRAPQMRF
jgi:hypothetical protein